MGKDSGGQSQELAGQAALRQVALAEKLYGQTEPLRLGGIDILGQAMRSEQPLRLPYFAPALEGIGEQSRQAREGIISSGIRGGQLNQSLANLETSRMRTIGELNAQERTNALGLGLSTGFGNVGSTLGTMQGGAGTLAGIGAAQQAQENQVLLGTGQTLGLLGAAGKAYGSPLSGIGKPALAIL